MPKKNFLIIAGLVIFVAITLSIVSRREEPKTPESNILGEQSGMGISDIKTKLPEQLKNKHMITLETNFGEIQI